MATRRRRGRPRGGDPGPSKQDILDAAVRVVSEVGLPAASLDKIAKAAGATKTTVLYHFSSRDGLVTALGLHALRDFQEGVVTGGRMPEDDFARAEAGVRSFFRKEYRPALIVMRELMSRGAFDPAAGELVQMAIETRVHMIASLLDLPAPLALRTARSLVLAGQGCVDAWICSGHEDPAPYRRAALEVTRALLTAAHREADS